MNTRYYMVIIKGEIKTSEIMSCGYNRNTQKWDVKFNNGKTYSYAYLNVEKLTDPEVLNPNMYRISREVHFTELSGRHSVLERPLSEVNGRLFFS